MPIHRTPEEISKAVEKEALDDEMSQAASMSVSDAEKGLAAAGFDVDAEKAEARAWRDELVVAAPTRVNDSASLSQVRSLRPPARRPIVLWLAAAAAVLALGGEWLSVTLFPEVASHLAPANASELRHQAVAACDAMRWRECLARFDEAARIDPPGDADAKVQAERAKARAAIDAEPK
jgi:hypothetical protein